MSNLDVPRTASTPINSSAFNKNLTSVSPKNKQKQQGSRHLSFINHSSSFVNHSLNSLYPFDGMLRTINNREDLPDGDSTESLNSLDHHSKFKTTSVENSDSSEVQTYKGKRKRSKQLAMDNVRESTKKIHREVSTESSSFIESLNTLDHQSKFKTTSVENSDSSKARTYGGKRKRSEELTMDRLKEFSNVAKVDEENTLDTNETLKQLIIRLFNCLCTKINGIKGQLIDIINDIAHVKMISKTPGVHIYDDIDLDQDEELDGFTLPCDTLEAVRAFDEKLKTDREYRKKVCLKIRSSIKKNSPSIARNLGDTIRLFITRKVGNQMTPLKKVPGKEVFSELKLYTCIYGMYSSVLGVNNEPIPIKTFEAAIRGVINNAGDWGKGRSHRQKKQQSPMPDIELED